MPSRPFRPSTWWLAACLAVPAAPLAAQQGPAIDLSAIDPALVIQGVGDVILRAPDRDIDGVYQAVHAASRDEREAEALCALFDADADRSLLGLQRAANALGPDSRQRFVDAVLALAVSGSQGVPRPYDAAAAEQVLRQAGVSAMLLHDGFMIGMSATGDDAASRAARCRSFRQLVDVMQDFPLEQRALATRYLLREGLDRYGAEF
ncbi:hypothetical protein [Luteimonas huabeiensis]|uniref:hypothetical protein n=1 Tax=Luteimonas huabeiensis TaxID=1244513 RepID=UPI0004645D6C|nr:hypothetical protein [Luteimonas huabeiensis]